MLRFRNIKRKPFNPSVLKTRLNNAPAAKKSKNDIQIIIVGAGLAGLSAANHLIKNGYKSTVILEATDRYGGRVNSKQFGDAFCELGAKWITIDATKGSVYELLRNATGLQNKIKQKNEMYYVTTSGDKINQKIPNLVEMLYKKLCSRIELSEKYKAGELYDLNNVHTYFQAETNKIVKSIFKETEQGVASDIFTSLFKEYGSLFGCGLEYVNIEHITKMEGQHNSDPLYIPTGLDNILNHIMDNIIDSSHMKTGKPVGEIKWHAPTRQDQKTVGCMDGSTFVADHIICTLPLGVLKNFSSYIFKPMLPKEKLKAIKNIGFGSPVKIYFEYKNNIKPWFATNIRPLWNASERKNNLIWTKQVVEISKLSTSTRVLEILVGGSLYNEIEKLPDIEVAQEITKILRTFLKNPQIPYPASMLRSNWSSSACYLGGRPYFSTGSTVADVTALASPLGDAPSLLFAGDATILNGFGNIDGARISGIREAQRIIEYYNKMT